MEDVCVTERCVSPETPAEAAVSIGGLTSGVSCRGIFLPLPTRFTTRGRPCWFSLQLETCANAINSCWFQCLSLVYWSKPVVAGGFR